VKLEFKRCRDFGAGLPNGTPGVQLGLHARPCTVTPLNGACFHCDRRAHVYVRQQGQLVGLCTFHIGRRLPMTVRRCSFTSLRNALAKVGA
jgi:Ni,Fe-hydrogenase I small subunit